MVSTSLVELARAVSSNKALVISISGDRGASPISLRLDADAAAADADAADAPTRNSMARMHILHLITYANGIVFSSLYLHSTFIRP